MADIATIWDPANGIGDWLLSPPLSNLILDETGRSLTDENGQPLLSADSAIVAGQGLAAGNDLSTAVLISLFSDAAADDDDVISDGSGDPRGWWAGPVGSKLWLRLRAKRSDTTLALVKSDIEAALAWLLEDGVASAVAVSTEWQSPNRLAALIVITRGNGRQLSLNFAWAWEGI